LINVQLKRINYSGSYPSWFLLIFFKNAISLKASDRSIFH